MSPPEPVIQDNRRAVVRAVSTEVLKALAALAPSGGGDMISLMVFTGIWTGNTQHLTKDMTRYSSLADIPPDRERRPVTEEELERTILIPQPILGDYVERLVAKGMVERRPTGLVVPSAVFTTPEQIDGTNEFYSRMLGLVSTLRSVGFGFGDRA
jgi:hypothetical protein